MKKYISIITAFILLLICSNLLGDDFFVTIWNATGHEMHDCGIYINATQVLVNGVWEPGFTDYIFPVTNPDNAIVWAYGYTDYYGLDFYASGQNAVFWNPNTNRWETTVEVTGGPDEVIFNITVNNPIDDAYNCSLIRNPGPDQEILFENGTISTGSTTYNEYEIYVGDEILVEGDVDGFYPGQVYVVSDLEVTDSYFDSQTFTLEIFVDLVLEYEDIPDYEFRTTNLSSEGWNWVSFPVIDSDYNDPIQHVLAPILGDLEEVQHEKDRIYYGYGMWVNGIGDFRSIDGYKIKMNNDADLEVAGWWGDLDTEIPLYEGQENWIGCFLEEPLSLYDAFASIWDYWTCIYAKEWAVCRCFPNWQQNMRGTVNPGELYIVTVTQDCGLVWGTGEPKPPYEKPETEYFTYTETSEYEPIIIDTVYGAAPEEIGVFIGGECIGGSKTEDGYPVFVPAYIADDTTRYEVNEITFGIYNGNRNELTQVKGVKVYDPASSAYVYKPIYLNKDDFKVVRLNTEEAPVIPVEFSLYQNYPNPIRTSTTISFSTPEHTDNTEIMIYNVKGQLVKTLLPTTSHQSALTNVFWNGTDENGNQLSNGIYFYKLTSGEKTAFKKMILLR